ncbi:helix-turn-helix domain-containing protein [Saccharolobus islandicus]|uniref:Bacterio-opsin activator HTH domain protein n=3 Tax=Saccharolobus islandicus TaxID=43080 RepID=C4KKK5_SACI6|nr:helix-turn-helix domain-containing protein [Sulfolobus islandicus]ACP38997.1 Bacterio-opsin activator HTH domain protein [Sulfolobus islandicus M.14.25]ACP56202.1 Bacterio-opsin activator HTH domain protein [Sulfolobus islandicus M.16.27]ACR42867.1 Bacterio-opsin activator HTH domain protein [Sulfolobus islandicus M.16.4]
MIKSYTIVLSHDDWSRYTERFNEEELYVKVVRRIPSLDGLTENVMGIIYAKDKESYRQIIRMLSRNETTIDFRIIDEYKNKSNIRAIYASIESLRGRIAERLLKDCRIFSMSETIYEGMERWNVIADSENFIKIIPEVKELTYEFKIIEESSNPLLSVKEELTPKELSILKLAFDKGYFETPKRIGLEELANELGISKPAIMQVLRKAIAKLTEKSIKDF